MHQCQHAARAAIAKHPMAAVCDATFGNHVTIAPAGCGSIRHALNRCSHCLTAHCDAGCKQFIRAQTCKALTAAAAAAVAMPAPLARTQLNLHTSRWKALWQCLLLAVAAASAAPVLLLLDTGERATMGWQMLQQYLMLSRPPSELQQQQQQLRTATVHMRRPIVPVWPQVQPMALAVSPLVLLLLPQCACAAPATLLGSSLVLQAYLNLELAVLARADSSQTFTPPPATAAWAVSGKETLRVPTAGDDHPHVQVAAAASSVHTPTLAWGLAQRVPAAVRVFTGVQLAADIFRVGCLLCMARSIVWAAQAAVGTIPEHACVLMQAPVGVNGADGCLAAAAVAGKAATYLLRHLLPYVLGLLLCLGGAVVYTCSFVSRYFTA